MSDGGDAGRGGRRRRREGAGFDLDLERLVTVYACDIDGCLAAAGHANFDLAALGEMAVLNGRSDEDPAVPALTIVTGRPHAYVDAISQLLRVDLPFSFENGAGLATRRPYRAWFAPEVGEGRAELRAFVAVIEREPRMMLQPGKVASLSVFPAVSGYDLEDLEHDVGNLLRAGGFSLLLDPSTDCMNVLVPGINKASGFDWLLKELEVAPEAVAGIGDSVGDLAWLRRCGVSIAPGNAVPQVWAAVDLKLPGQDVAAALAGYEALVAANRRLLGR
ncbi:MAG TPA: HAD hydrolase family protein [Trueperaceae bacterium]|nr:HAD hydrolase family protein [Trueperaceae bacterium]